MNAIDLDNGLKLVKSPADGIMSGGDHWDLVDQENNHVGEFTVAVYKTEQDKWKVPWVRNSLINRAYRGQGLGRLAMKAIVKHYGVLRSDPGGMQSSAASKAWKAIGAKRLTDRDRKYLDFSSFVMGKNQVKEAVDQLLESPDGVTVPAVDHSRLTGKNQVYCSWTTVGVITFFVESGYVLWSENDEVTKGWQAWTHGKAFDALDQLRTFPETSTGDKTWLVSKIKDQSSRKDGSHRLATDLAGRLWPTRVISFWNTASQVREHLPLLEKWLEGLGVNFKQIFWDVIDKTEIMYRDVEGDTEGNDAGDTGGYAIKTYADLQKFQHTPPDVLANTQKELLKIQHVTPDEKKALGAKGGADKQANVAGKQGMIPAQWNQKRIVGDSLIESGISGLEIKSCQGEGARGRDVTFVWAEIPGPPSDLNRGLRAALGDLYQEPIGKVIGKTTVYTVGGYAGSDIANHCSGLIVAEPYRR